LSALTVPSPPLMPSTSSTAGVRAVRDRRSQDRHKAARYAPAYAKRWACTSSGSGSRTGAPAAVSVASCFIQPVCCSESSASSTRAVPQNHPPVTRSRWHLGDPLGAYRRRWAATACAHTSRPATRHPPRASALPHPIQPASLWRTRPHRRCRRDQHLISAGAPAGPEPRTGTTDRYSRGASLGGIPRGTPPCTPWSSYTSSSIVPYRCEGASLLLRLAPTPRGVGQGRTDHATHAQIHLPDRHLGLLPTLLRRRRQQQREQHACPCTHAHMSVRAPAAQPPRAAAAYPRHPHSAWPRRGSCGPGQLHASQLTATPCPPAPLRDVGCRPARPRRRRQLARHRTRARPRHSMRGRTLYGRPPCVPRARRPAAHRALGPPTRAPDAPRAATPRPEMAPAMHTPSA
jgi:hypothetical protein